MNKFHKFILIVEKSYYLNTLIKHKVAAGVEHKHVFSYLSINEFKTIIDIGANRGQFALISRCFFPQARIFSFEPLPEPAKRFRCVFAGDANVVLYNFAIDEESGTVEIHLSAQDDSSSLLPIGEMQTCIFPGTEEVSTQQVKIATLDAILCAEEIEPPSLLKLDVQGFELNTLRGCETLLYRFDYVYCECSFVELYSGQALACEVITWLQERDFVLAGIYNVYYAQNGQAVQADFLFTRYKGLK